MAFDANQFLDGLFGNPAPEEPITVAPPEPDSSVTAVAADDPDSHAADEDAYSRLIDQLNADCPDGFVMTDDRFRLLDTMFERVVDAQKFGNPQLVQSAVTACERAAQQLFDEVAGPILEEVLLF